MVSLLEQDSTMSYVILINILVMNASEIERTYYDWEEQLEREYNELFSDSQYNIFDGVISPKDYYLSPIKVLFLNREAYDEDSYSISQALKHEIETGKKIFGGKAWININTKERLAYCFLLSRILDISENDAISYAQDMGNDEYRSLLYKSAYCNIKKSNGVDRSSRSDLFKYAQKGWEIIMKQISYFNPTIIIGGNVIDGIIECLEDIRWGSPRILSRNGSVVIYQIEFGGNIYPFVDMYHPSSRHHSYDLLYALRSVAQNYPGYWEKRISQECF